jgi:hypothetical protein
MTESSPQRRGDIEKPKKSRAQRGQRPQRKKQSRLEGRYTSGAGLGKFVRWAGVLAPACVSALSRPGVILKSMQVLLPDPMVGDAALAPAAIDPT